MQKGSGSVAIRSPYIQVYGIQLDPDANGAAVRSFTPQEEEEFLAISRRPNFYKEFIDSFAPQIYGSDGLTLTYIRYQESHRLSFILRVQEVLARRHASSW
jgi:hypothetical protein